MREMEHDLPRKSFILDTLFQRWKPALGTEIAPLELAIGRVPARSEYAEVTIPVKRASMLVLLKARGTPMKYITKSPMRK